jgi:F-type H+-transporting ATPase subunit b
MISLDYTILVQIASFLLLWFFLNRLIFTPFRRVIEEREQRTDGVKTETESLIEERRRLQEEVESQIARARAEGKSIKEAILQEALRTREHLLNQAQGNAAQVLQTAREDIQQEVQRVHGLVAKEAEAIAQQMAEKILGRKIG